MKIKNDAEERVRGALSRAAGICVATLAAVSLPSPAVAGKEVCQGSGGSMTCQPADYWFTNSRANGDRAKYKTAEEICAKFVWEEKNYKLINPRWVPYQGNHIDACVFDSCQFAVSHGEPKPRWHCLEVGYDWAAVGQQCPSASGSSPLYTSWTDSADRSITARGRLWCAYRKALGDAPPPGSSGGGGSDGGANNGCSAPPAGGSTDYPILPTSGDKYFAETDWIDGGEEPLSFVRYYRSSLGLDNARPAQGVARLGRIWSHSHAFKLAIQISAEANIATLTDPRGYQRAYSPRDGTPSGIWTSRETADTLSFDGAQTWRLHEASGKRVLVFAGGGSGAVSQSAQLVSVEDARGRKTSYQYDGDYLISISSAVGRTMRFSYDTAGNLSAITTPDERVYAYGYDSVGRLVSVTYPDSTTRRYIYANGSFPNAVTDIKDETGATFLTVTYDSSGRASQSSHSGVDTVWVNYLPDGSSEITDQTGTKRVYRYSVQNGHAAVIGSDKPAAGTNRADAASRVQDEHGLIQSETDFNGVRKEFRWDVSRRLVLSTTEAAGTSTERTVTTQWHPTMALPVNVIEPGRTTSFSYDAGGNLVSKAVLDTKTNETRTWTWSYDANGFVISQTEPGRQAQQFKRDSNGNITQSIDALGSATQYTYDAANRVTRVIASNGVATNFAWDARDRLLSQTIGAGAPFAQTTTMTYTATGLLASLSLPSGLVYRYSYDQAHRFTGWKDNRGNARWVSWNNTGVQTADTLQRLGETGVLFLRRTVNSLNRVNSERIGVFANDSNVDTYSFDANGERIGKANGLNQSQSYRLDALRRLNSITNELNSTATINYDGLNAVTSVKDFKGVQTGFDRDAQGKARLETSTDIGALQTSYDALGLPQRIVDSLGRAIQVVRDAVGRPVRISHEGGTQTILRYDLEGAEYNSGSSKASKGFLSEIQDPGITTRFQRDDLGRIVRKTQIVDQAKAGTADVPARTHTLQYGWVPAGKPGAGQLAGITYPSGRVLAYQYDASGQLTGVTWNGKPLVLDLRWNPLAQPTYWRWSGMMRSGSVATATRSFNTAGMVSSSDVVSALTLDGAGRIASGEERVFLPAVNGAVVSSREVRIKLTFTHDAAGKLIGVAKAPVDSSVVLPAGFALAQFIGPENVTYKYDANGNRSQAVYVSSQPGGGTETVTRNYSLAPEQNRVLGYSESVQYTGATAAPSRTPKSFVWSPAGELLSAGSVSFGYDAEGRLSSSRDGSSIAEHDTNRLSQRVRKRSLTASGYAKWQTSVYADEVFPVGAPGYTSWPIAQYGETGDASVAAESVEYLYLPTGSGPLPVAVLVGDKLYGVHADHLNTPRRLFDASGNTVWQWPFSGFGETPPGIAADGFAVDGSSLPIPNMPRIEFDLRYPGQVFDKESGLHANHHRFYDPQVGRYVTSDPIGLAGGWNRFSYAGGNALLRTDPRGLDNPGMGPYGPCWGGACGRIEDTARSNLGSDKWDRPDLRNTCNLGVYDNLLQADVPAPSRYPLLGHYPLGAGEGGWGDPSSSIPGWTITNSPQPGDVAAGDGGTGSPHVGIVVTRPDGSLGTAGVSSETGTWTETSWPFRRRDKPATFWRCTCQ